MARPAWPPAWPPAWLLSACSRPLPRGHHVSPRIPCTQARERQLESMPCPSPGFDAAPTPNYEMRHRVSTPNRAMPSGLPGNSTQSLSPEPKQAPIAHSPYAHHGGSMGVPSRPLQVGAATASCVATAEPRPSVAARAVPVQASRICFALAHLPRACPLPRWSTMQSPTSAPSAMPSGSRRTPSPPLSAAHSPTRPTRRAGCASQSPRARRAPSSTG